ncbi:Mtla [Buchnera aphidicola str. G002 (Myzus persicae)]|uniref:PTS system mannitol-specific EIICBA component n=1 Tax=Buchnera aphidicola str. USDA (Myzus persicae) TaxID=1009856 RepID=W0NZE4_BUCMP|nr:PTS mannitol transporter subunit IICBA [Buchnera aphidicola]AHG59834.1 Mtla [Buchnera aphidicola str. USDA (Myzus persicae)]AHG60414.1 Mtla [Buchnera aphidicola str. W106 (Myzus persicae)]AHG60987.1 Mtla [Buchnera aphidicola str. G002 (Myzus persicae)]WAI02925.1 MAG: PTS mannitol transporter subunit IICBA [Buchnera aphidicola (Myzus persicae)]
MFTLIKLKIQNFGQFLSNMIMPNISIFITWGIMTALFIPLGWQPNKILEQLISPVIFYLLPILIGYTGGRLISGDRGGLVGSITTIGVITSTNIPMLLGAMISGPLGGWIIKYFDKKIENKVKNGFEMLVNNFSIAIFGILLAIISFFTIGPFIEWISHVLESLIKVIVSQNLLPFISIVIEPAKIFFLNNAINHGIFSPLGIQDASDNHRSIFFLIESNPGPGLGVLIAWFFFGKGELRKSSGGAAIIEFLGGVHEIYFPYVLMKPKLIIALILGGMTGIFMLVVLDGGVISAVSPGSILSILTMTPKGLYFSNMIAIFSSFIISFISASLLLKFNFYIASKNNQKIVKKNKNFLNSETLKNDYHDVTSTFFKNIKTIIVACDAGMGSSAMGASILRKKIKNANLTNISVLNMAINLLPKNADLIITHQNLTHRAKKYAPHAHHISLKNFLNNSFYDNLIKKLRENIVLLDNHVTTSLNINHKNIKNNLFQLTEKNILLNQYATNKEEAINIVGKHLVKQGYVKFDYINSMIEREKIASTWLGESIALPHGTIEGKNSVLKTGIIFCQFPKGVHFGEELDDIAYLVIGIAAKNNEHIMVVSNITNALDDKDTIRRLSQTTDIKEVLSLLNIEKK